MADQRDYSRVAIAVTFVAAFLVMVSTWLAWYELTTNGTTTDSYWLISDYHGLLERDVGNLMSGVKVLICLWFALAFAFITQQTSKEVSLTSVVAVGGILMVLGISILAYFAVVLPDVAESPAAAGFYWTISYGNVTYAGSPGTGYAVFALACVVQTIAVALGILSVYSQKLLRESRSSGSSSN